jgi:uncharacterized protein
MLKIMTMKRIYIQGLLLILISFTSSELYSQKVIDKKLLPGSWLGTISYKGVEQRLVFNIKLNDKDSLIITAESPDQGVKIIPMGPILIDGETIDIKAPLLLAEYKGTMINDTILNGTWSQRGLTLPLKMIKLQALFSLNRPQEPKPSFPYISEDITFLNSKSNIRLAGTLTLPKGNGPFKAAILITGSGGQNRNEEIQGHKPFLVISDWLTRNGIAVLRFDDRGVGKSQGSQFEATSEDFATDVEAAFEFLKTQKKINPEAIGLIGHSEGGLIAPIVASTNPEIAFIVSLAGPGVTGQQIILKQSEEASRASGITEQNIKKSTEINKKLFAVLRKEKDNKKAEKKILALYREILQEEKMPAGSIDKAVSSLKATFGESSYTWYRYFLTTDAATFWKKVKCPVLALNGEKDMQVSPVENLPAIEKAVTSNGNKSVRAIKLPGLNHLFQHSQKGLPSEYGKIDETFSPEALKIISDWINSLILVN